MCLFEFTCESVSLRVNLSLCEIFLIFGRFGRVFGQTSIGSDLCFLKNFVICLFD